MISQLLRKRKELHFERSYAAPVDAVWRAWTEADRWTEGEEETATIRHTNDLTLTDDGDGTVLTLDVAITEIGPKAKLAAFGMKWGYKAQLDALDKLLAG